VRGLGFALAIMVSVGACDGAGNGSGEVTDARIDEVTQQFAAVGVELVRMSDRQGERFGRTVSMEPRREDQDAKRRFGTFSVSVLDIDRWLAAGIWDEDDLSQVEWNEQVPEREGDPDPYWTASRFYGRNVQLIWRTPDKKLDERWRRLNAVLLPLDSQ
jgi:hypothetical protein